VRALFFGTPEIAVPALEALAGLAEVVAVVCQPDRPAGRGLALRAPAVKRRAIELGLAVAQPTKIKTAELAEWVGSLRAEVGVVMAYGRILPQALLDAPERGMVNLHASILPKYRGASPITWAVVNGEARTGISLMQMDAGMDTGPVYSRREVEIGPDETAGELGARLAALAALVVREDLPRVVSGVLRAEPQEHAAATHAPLLDKEHGRVAWERPAREVHDHVRGMSPWPGAFTWVRGKRLKVLRTRALDAPERGGPGRVLVADPSGIVVACGTGAVELLVLQLEGRRALGAREAVAGRLVRTGEVLGADAAPAGGPAVRGGGS
jgi:methionyl-tRNA formyltransferase